MTLGKKVRLRRKILGISQSELSQLSGVSQPYISEIENGGYSPTATVLAVLARALNCTTDYLIYDENKK